MENTKATLSFCIDSVLKFKDKEHTFKNRPVVADEIMSFRKHLLHSKHIPASVRNQCLEILGKILRVCGNIILLDGHASDNAVRWIHEVAGVDRPVVKYYNEKKSQPTNITLILGTFKDGYDGETTFDSFVENIPGINYNDDSAIQSLILNDDRKIYVSADSRNLLTELHRQLTKKNPDVKRLLITSDTNNNQDVRDFIANPVGELEKHQYQSVLVSPSGDSGLDISITGYFKHDYHVGYGVTDASSAHQATFRVRDASCPRTVFIRANPIGVKKDDSYDVNAEINAKEAQIAALTKVVLDADFLADNAGLNIGQLMSKIGEQYNTPNGRAAVETAVQTQYETAYNRECLEHLYKEAGHNINYVVLSPDGQVKESIKEGIAALKTERAQLIVDAELVTDEEVAELDSEQYRTPEQQAEITKHRLNQRLPGIVESDAFTAELVQLLTVDDKQLGNKLTRKYFVDNKKIAKVFYEKEVTRMLKTFAKTGQSVNTDIKLDYLKFDALIDAKLPAIAKLGKWSAKSTEVRDFIKVLNTLEFQQKMGVKLTKKANGAYIAKKFDDKAAMKFIKEWLRWLGIEIKAAERPREGNTRTQYYEVNTKYYNEPGIAAIQQCISTKYQPAVETLEEGVVIPFGKPNTEVIQSNILDMFGDWGIAA